MEILRNVPRMETIRNTAKLLGLSEDFVRSKAKSGEIVAVKNGNRYLVNVDKLVDYLNTSKVTVNQRGGLQNV